MRHSTQLLADPERCIHVVDRENDIYELYCAAKELNTHFLVRTCVDRLAGDGKHTVADEMEYVPVKGVHKFEIITKSGKLEKIALDVKYKIIKVLPLIGKQKKYPSVILTIIHAEEHKTPKNRERISWKLIADLKVNSKTEAVEKFRRYSLR